MSNATKELARPHITKLLTASSYVWHVAAINAEGGVVAMHSWAGSKLQEVFETEGRGWPRFYPHCHMGGFPKMGVALSGDSILFGVYKRLPPLFWEIPIFPRHTRPQWSRLQPAKRAAWGPSFGSCCTRLGVEGALLHTP